MTGHSEDWVLATHNSGKTRELQDLFASLPVRLTSAKDLELPEPDETGTTFEANAELKSLAAAKATGRVAIADDSGVAVHALGGEPGIHTARWAGEPRDFDIARRRVEAGRIFRMCSPLLISRTSMKWANRLCLEGLPAKTVRNTRSCCMLSRRRLSNVLTQPKPTAPHRRPTRRRRRQKVLTVF